MPMGVGIESVAGLKSSDPENANAVATSGEVTKECVPGLPSWRLRKDRILVLRLSGEENEFLPSEVTVE